VRFSLALQSLDPRHCRSVDRPLDTPLFLPRTHLHRVRREPMGALLAVGAAASPAAIAAAAALSTAAAVPPPPSPCARLTTEQRWMRVALHEQGCKKRRIAAEVGCHVHTVSHRALASHRRRALGQPQRTPALHRREHGHSYGCGCPCGHLSLCLSCPIVRAVSPCTDHQPLRTPPQPQPSHRTSLSRAAAASPRGAGCLLDCSSGVEWAHPSRRTPRRVTTQRSRDVSQPRMHV